MSGDGFLARAPSEDELSLAWNLDDLDPELAEKVTQTDVLRQHVVSVLARSALAQLQLDLDLSQERDVAVEDGTVYVPVQLSTYGALGEKLHDELLSLRRGERDLVRYQDQPLEFGRLLDKDSLIRLHKGQVTRAIDNGFIFVEKASPMSDDPEGMDYRINEDGSISLPLKNMEFLIDSGYLMRNRDAMFEVLFQGRAGLMPYVDTIERDPEDELGEFMIGGVVLSGGPYYMRIRDVDAGRHPIKQLRGGSFFDRNRIMGTAGHLPRYDRLRQVELTTKKSAHTKIEDVWVTLDVYEPAVIDPDNSDIKWGKLKAEERLRRHLYGITPLDVMRGDQYKGHEAVLQSIFADITNRDISGLVITHKGVREIEHGYTYNFTQRRIREALASSGRTRGLPKGLEHLSDLTNRLVSAGERSRVLIAEKLEVEDIARLADEYDVRSFVVKSFGKLAMDSTRHATLVRLARAGISVSWLDEYIDDSGEQTELREFHPSGLWVSPEKVEQLENLEVVIPMYGGNKDAVGDALEDEIRTFIVGLIKQGILPEKIGIAHGNGPGVMRVADKLAREYGLFSIGIGIDVEDIGQGTINRKPDAIAYFEAYERLYRQNMLDNFGTIPIFNVGGYGTLEELAISICSQKLMGSMLSPKISVDQMGIFDGVRETAVRIGNTDEIIVNGKVVAEEENILGSYWAAHTIESVNNYREALEIIAEYIAHPERYWQKAQISKKELQLAYLKQQRQSERSRIRVPEFVSRGYEAFLRQAA